MDITEAIVLLQKLKNQIRDIFPLAMKDKIDALNKGIETLDKQIPRKTKITIHGTTGYSTKEYCPVCNAMVYGNYCWNCGQALDRGYRKNDNRKID